jgi:hypothetical protein
MALYAVVTGGYAEIKMLEEEDRDRVAKSSPAV